MKWTDLDALANALRRTLKRGSLRGLPPIIDEPTRIFTPELLARIVLADIEHVRELERDGSSPNLDERRQELANLICALLALRAAHRRISPACPITGIGGPYRGSHHDWTALHRPRSSDTTLARSS